MNPSAQIRSDQKNSPFLLRTTQTSRGVFFDLIDEEDENNGRRFIISVRPKSARALAKWILKNVEEE